MSLGEIQFSLIATPLSAALCDEFVFQRGGIGMQYRSQPHRMIDLRSIPENIVDVARDGNCLYRAISVHLSGSELNYRKLKEMTDRSLQDNRVKFLFIDEDQVDDLRVRAIRDREWGEQSHMIALSIALRIRMYCFNPLLKPPQWERIDGQLKPEYPAIHVPFYITHMTIRLQFIYQYILYIVSSKLWNLHSF